MLPHNPKTQVVARAPVSNTALKQVQIARIAAQLSVTSAGP
jgi:hypothetical protein